MHSTLTLSSSAPQLEAQLSRVELRFQLVNGLGPDILHREAKESQGKPTKPRKPYKASLDLCDTTLS